MQYADHTCHQNKSVTRSLMITQVMDNMYACNTNRNTTTTTANIYMALF